MDSAHTILIDQECPLDYFALFIDSVVAAASSGCTAYFFKRTPSQKLLVVPVIDSLPPRQINDYRDQLARAGLARFPGRRVCSQPQRSSAPGTPCGGVR